MANNDPFQRMDTDDARSSLQKLSSEVHELSPDTLITLYEIDISDIKVNMDLRQNLLLEADIFCFHNMEITQGKKIIYDGKTFFAMPVVAEGFEMVSSGELPRPKLSIPSLQAIREKETEFSTDYPWNNLKRAVLELDNLVGAKVTRIRTFAKYLDSTNEIPGTATDPDPKAQFPRDTFYIDAKTLEDKNGLQFELTTFTDMENFKLPGRHVLASRCPWAYRGQGCSYEFKGNPMEWETQREIHGPSGGQNAAPSHLPDYAPPIATKDNVLISELVEGYNPDNIEYTSDVHEYYKVNSYSKGDVVYLVHKGYKYYFVAKQAVSAYNPPPNEEYWVADECAKSLRACKIRWGTSGSAKNEVSGTAGKSAANDFLNFG